MQDVIIPISLPTYYCMQYVPSITLCNVMRVIVLTISDTDVHPPHIFYNYFVSQVLDLTPTVWELIEN
jgi:hypothetical protein